MSAMNCDETTGDWPWEADESKRYPPKDPALLTDFEKRYLADPASQEASDNARVWRVYQDRMNAIDEDTISAWNDSINFLLIFAGLFSAVLTAFVIESSKQLERDPSEATVELLTVLVSHFNGSAIPSRSELALYQYTAPASARVTNAFWFLSLSLALLVSMLAILAKQWITMFSSRMRAPVANFRRWAHRHRVFRDGFDRWHLNAFISSLSVALHGAVLMFLAGLVVHLFTRDKIIFGLVLAITVLAVAFYVAATVAPMFDGTCPTATPLLIHGRLACLTLLRAVSCLFDASARDAEAGNQLVPCRKPPFDADVVLADGGDSQRDVRILMLMFSALPAGHDVDAALDAVGGLDPAQHDLGEDLVRVRYHARRRLEQLGATVGIAACDFAAIARALRSLIFVESCAEHLHWPNFGALMAGLRSIRTHDMFALSTILQLQLERQRQGPVGELEQLELDKLQWQEQQLLGMKKWQERINRKQQLLEQLARLEQDPLTHMTQIMQVEHLKQEQSRLRARYRFGEEDMLELRRQRQQRLDHRLKQLQYAFGIAEAIARWKVQNLPPSRYPVSPQIHACLYKCIGQIISNASTSQPLSLELCAALVIGFGGEPDFRKQCNELVTPLAIAAIDRERGRQGGKEVWPSWSRLPDTADWRLRAIELWAHVTASLSDSETVNSIVDKVYAHILDHWADEDEWPPRPTTVRLRRIVLKPRQPSLPTKARVVLWNIASSTSATARMHPLQPEIVHDIFHGVSPDEMVAADPTIVDSLFGFARQHQGERVHGFEMSYQYFNTAYHHLMALMQPNSSTPVSDSETTWNILQPYLIASPDDEGLADLTADAVAILSIHAGMGGDAYDLFEQLLGGGIGRRVILSHGNRDDAFFVATHGRLFAKAWWEEMRTELLQIDPTTGTWVPPEKFEDAVTFVQKVEEVEVCSECLQKGCAWLPQLEEERYHHTWIQFIEPGWTAIDVSDA